MCQGKSFKSRVGTAKLGSTFGNQLKKEKKSLLLQG